MTYRTPTEGKFWAQSDNHRIAYAAHGVKATMAKRGANPIVRPAQYAIQRAFLDPVERFDWGTWFSKYHYDPEEKLKKLAGYEPAEKTDVHQGAFLALLPENPELMTIAGGTPAADLHCTLVYLGPAVELTQTTKRAVLAVARAWAAVRGLQATVTGFGPLGDAAQVAFLEGPALVRGQAELKAALEGAGVKVDETFPVFKPHVTLAYAPAFSAVEANSVLVAPVVFRELLVSFGEVRRTYPLGAEPVFKSNPEGINQYTSGHTTITDAEHRILHNTGSAEKLVGHLNSHHGTSFKPDKYHSQQPGGKPGFRGLGLHYRQVHMEAHRLGKITKAASDPLEVGSIDPIIEGFKKKAKAKVDQAIKDLHQDAAAHVVAQLNLPHAPEDLQAGLDATFQQYSTGITDNAADELRTVLEDTLAEGWGSPAEFSKELRSRWDTFSKDQADTIAWTEYNTVASQATLSSYRANGVEYKAWLTVGDGDVCDECQGNEDEGPIPIDQEFSSGDDAPPQHPNCRCNVTSVVSPDSALPSDYSDLPELQKYAADQERDEAGRWTSGAVESQLKNTTLTTHTPEQVASYVGAKMFGGFFLSPEGTYYGPTQVHIEDLFEQTKLVHEDDYRSPGGLERSLDKAQLIRITNTPREVGVQSVHLPTSAQRRALRQLNEAVSGMDRSEAPNLLHRTLNYDGPKFVDDEGRIFKYSDDEARDERGMWTAGAVNAAIENTHGAMSEGDFVNGYGHGFILRNGHISGVLYGPEDLNVGHHEDLLKEAGLGNHTLTTVNGQLSLVPSRVYGKGGVIRLLPNMATTFKGVRYTPEQLSTLARVKLASRELHGEPFQHDEMDLKTGEVVQKSGWSRLVQFMKDMGGGAGIGSTEGTFTTGDLSVGGGFLAPRQGLPRKPKKTDPGAPQPVHGVDDQYWNLEQDPISGEYKVRQGTRR